MPDNRLAESAHVLRVLVVDDFPELAGAVAQALRRRGYDAEHCETGEECLELAQVFRPNIVLLDIRLLGMDGFETARQLRTLPEMRSAVLMAITSMIPDGECARFAEAGFDLHLRKPLDLAELDVVLRRAAAQLDGRTLVAGGRFTVPDAEERLGTSTEKRATPR
jgi:CheY-like chemotaxis protein